MKKLRKLLALTSSLVLCSSFFTAFNANAVAILLDRNSQEYKEYLSSYTKINDYGLFESWEWYNSPYPPAPYNFYVHESGKHFLYEPFLYNQFRFTLTDSEATDDVKNTIQSVLDTFDTSYEVTYNTRATDNLLECIVFDRNLKPETVRNAKLICSELKEQGIISDFVYSGDITTEMSPIYCAELTAYYRSDITAEELAEVMNKYVEEKELDCSVVILSDEEIETFSGTAMNKKVVCVKPNKEITLEEHLKLAAQIKKDLGYGPSFAISTASSETGAYSAKIDLFNATYGDLNDDSKLTPVDASLLLSYYSESQTGTETEADMTYELLGDVNNDGKVTPVDASLVLRQYAENQTK